jgi:murein DD-endopeptidase MepM/ murein hydrolase activator NlpD
VREARGDRLMRLRKRDSRGWRARSTAAGVAGVAAVRVITAAAVATLALPAAPGVPGLLGQSVSGVRAAGENECGAGLPALPAPAGVRIEPPAIRAAPTVAPALDGAPRAGPSSVTLPAPAASSTAAAPAEGATAVPEAAAPAPTAEGLPAGVLARLAALRQIDEDLLRSAARMRDAEDALAEVEVALQALGAQVEAQQVAVGQRAAVYGSRLRALYKFTRTSPLEQLLAASDFGDLVRRATLIRSIVQMDQRLLKQLRAEYERLIAMQAALREREQAAAALRDEIAGEHETLAAKRAELAAAAQADAAALWAQESVTASSIVALQARYQPELVALERQRGAAGPQSPPGGSAPRVAGGPAVAVPGAAPTPPGQPAARPPGTAPAGGAVAAPAAGAMPAPALALTWPVLNAVVTTEFGEPNFAQSAHTGIDLAQRQLAPVLAAADGIVLSCGLAVPGAPEQSYGMVVVIAHDRTVATLYAHLEASDAPPAVTPGQRVQRGQIVGYIGMTGLTTGPHLHFEVRVSGQSQDPRAYLPF